MTDTSVADIACGHHHTIGNYANGCAHSTQMALAIAAARDGDRRTAQHRALVAGRILWPLAEINNPDSLRDFIAGANSGLEAHLRSLGTAITS